MFVPRLVGLMVGWMASEPMVGPWHSASEAPLPSSETPQLPPALRPAISAIIEAIIGNQSHDAIVDGSSFEAEEKKVGFGKLSAPDNLGLYMSSKTSCRWVLHLFSP